MQGFDEIQLDPLYSLGVVCGPTFRTDLLELDSGAEGRDSFWPTGRRRYDLASTPKTSAQMDALRTFFMCRKGRLRGFRFKDWTDYQATAQPCLSPSIVQSGYAVCTAVPQAYFGAWADISVTPPPPPPNAAWTQAQFAVGYSVQSVDSLYGYPTFPTYGAGMRLNLSGGTSQVPLTTLPNQAHDSRLTTGAYTDLVDANNIVNQITSAGQAGTPITGLQLIVATAGGNTSLHWTLGNLLLTLASSALPTVLQLYKSYPDAVNPINRKITKPVAGTVKVYKNGTLRTAGTDYTLDTTQGILTLPSAPAGGDVYTWTGEFDVPVRFDTDTMRFTARDAHIHQWEQIPILELLS